MSTLSTAAPQPAQSVEQPIYYESKPAPGYGQSFSENEIRYCLAEDIRMDAEGAVLGQYERTVDHHLQKEVDRFNAAVEAYNARAADFNSRCSHFRYYESAMTRAKSDVENRRSLLAEEGRSRFHATEPQAVGALGQPRGNSSSKKLASNKSAVTSSNAPPVHVYKCKLDDGRIEYTNAPMDRTKCDSLFRN